MLHSFQFEKFVKKNDPCEPFTVLVLFVNVNVVKINYEDLLLLLVFSLVMLRCMLCGSEKAFFLLWSVLTRMPYKSDAVK